MFADAEILRNGNEQLLDGLEEGLIILEEEKEDKLSELYHNMSAKKLYQLGKSFSLLSKKSSDEDEANALIDPDATIFASCADILSKQ